jgi:hypothetical protein
MTPSIGRGPIGRLVMALLLGVGLGLSSALGDGASVRVLVALANAISPWLIVAFVAGALQQGPRSAAVAGGAALFAAAATYYLGIAMIQATGFPMHLAIVWFVLALVIGPAAAVLGAAWRSESRWRPRAAGVLAGALLGEATLQLVRIEAWDGFDLTRTYAQLAVANAVLAAAAIAVLVTPRGWPAAAGTALAVALLCLVALLGVDLAFREVIVGA